MRQRAQASIEFLILVGFLLAAFVLFFMTIQSNMSDKVTERAWLEIREVAKAFQEEISLAYTSTPGYSREFRPPTTKYLGTYTALINESILVVESEDETYIYSLVVEEVIGQPVFGLNTIRNEDGTLYLNA